MGIKDKFLFLGFFLFFAPVLILTEVALLTKVELLLGNVSGNNLIATISVSAEEDLDFLGQAFSSNEPSSTTMKVNVIAADARPALIRNYLKKYHSPLLAYADLIFAVSQKYGLDYRLIVAIAQQESNLCKRAPPNCFNCWGVGIHSRGTMCFDSYPDAIEWVAKYLREEYIDKGLTTPEEIMKKYCPLSDGSWAFGVKQFMQELE